MEKDVDMTKAKQVYQEICATLDDIGWKYKKDEEKLIIHTGAKGEDLPIDLSINVDALRQLVIAVSKLPFDIAENKRVDAAVAVSVINNMLVTGQLDYSLMDGELFFRISNSYRDSELSREVYRFMVYCLCQTIDGFNDKLLMLSKGIMNIEKFIELYQKA